MEKRTQKVRVRIAPSPTGDLHVGTARTALFNELLARGHGGAFILRLEDTDKERSKPEFEQSIIEGLQWLGLKWDEGPYRQSERTELYTKALEQLLDEDKAYKEDEAVRLRVTPQEVTFHDEVRGDVTVHTDSFGNDFVIARSITDPLFHLAVVVDDANMNITHVIRGEDHLHNTIKHILIQRALGYDQPAYAHLPLLLDEQRRKLSKRSGETNLLAYRDLGYLPEAMVNYLALLGWGARDDQEFFTHEELVKEFSLDRVQKGGAIFSLTKLNSINKEHLRQLSADELFERARPFLEQAGIDTSNKGLLTAALITEQERVATLADLPQAIAFSLPDWPTDYAPELLVWKKSDAATTRDLLQKTTEYLSALDESVFLVQELQTNLLAWIDEHALGRGDTLWPMRVALTGREHSPGPFEVAAILGKEETLRRLKVAFEKLAQ